MLKEKISKVINKVRVFQRIRKLMELNAQLNSEIIKIYEIKTNLRQSVGILKGRIEKLHTAVKQLESRRDEVIHRLQQKIPDYLVGGGIDNYKYWIAEPFIVEYYEHYVPTDDHSVFVDPHSFYKKIPEFLKKIENRKDDDKQDQTTDEKKTAE